MLHQGVAQQVAQVQPGELRQRTQQAYVVGRHQVEGAVVLPRVRCDVHASAAVPAVGNEYQQQPAGSSFALVVRGQPERRRAIPREFAGRRPGTRISGGVRAGIRSMTWASNPAPATLMNQQVLAASCQTPEIQAADVVRHRAVPGG
ncbi:MAG: hypothetical protein IPF50_15920 [Proteobacteria bacterium]|nr:hypothetical protein [Pseudomonadota bacterium]